MFVIRMFGFDGEIPDFNTVIGEWETGFIFTLFTNVFQVITDPTSTLDEVPREDFQ